MIGAPEHKRLSPRKLRLVGYRCNDCGELYPWWKIYCCEKCKGLQMTRVELSGQGKLVNYTVVYYPPKEFRGQEPYIIGQYEIDEGLKVPAPLVEVSADQVKVGDPVTPVLRRIRKGLDGEVYYSYKFKLAEAATA